MTKIQDLTLADVPALLSLNNAHAAETSWLDEADMAGLLEMAFYARGIDGGATALLCALDQNAPYENPNINWFKRRFKAAYEPFVYIDRIIVADAARGRGIARLLYEDLFAAARRAGHRRIVCEINLDPPNPASDAFHERMGFVKIGQASIRGGTKVVRYFERLFPG